MSDELNPDRPLKQPENRAPNREALAQALDDLLRGVSARDEAPESETDPCPEPGEWLRLVDGKAHPRDEMALMTHAAACGVCAQRLRTSLHLFSPEIEQEEAVELPRLASATVQWESELAARLAATPRRSTPKPVSRYLWAGAGMAASLALAAGIALWWQQLHTPERLLAEAYTRTRIFELRMPGAGFQEPAPQAHLRGSGSGREASKLLDARARIESRLESSPDDPHWLQLEARANLLEEKFDPAIDILDRLLAAGPVTASLLADDAAAYFQRGTATGSENDRATALDYLRRADELNPADPVVLFNEAIVMEDRGQVMNAVETWNRYLCFERDPRWLAEGRARLKSLEEKLKQLKTHQGRMEEHLATPQAMRALAADPNALAAIDEELSSSLLPRLLIPAFSLPVDRSRGSPCNPQCEAARELLHALAASLERNHQDPWLTQLLSAASSSPSDRFLQAAQTLGQAIAENVAGDYAHGRQSAETSRGLFHSLGNAAGEDRATAEQAYALQVLSDIPGCYRVAHSLLGRDPQFAWIQIHALTEDAGCDPAPGTGSENNPAFLRAVSQAQSRRYTLLELRARNWLGAAAVDTGDVENTWRIYLGTVRKFMDGDYPPSRLYSTLSGLEEVEESTPRLRNALLLQREAVGALELSQNQGLIPAERLHLAAVAIRAGAAAEAREQMRSAQEELAANGGGNSIRGFLVENENAMANLYLDRGDLGNAAKMLEAARGHIAGEKNSYHSREYALAQGRLELALGHPEAAESLLREAVIEDERLAANGGSASITLAEQDRDLYAVLAGVWLAQGRPGEEALALWERYRLRILGKRVAPCASKGLDCLKPALVDSTRRLGQGRVLGQIVLFDRVLLYQATAKGVSWKSAAAGRDEVLADLATLEHAASSPATSQASVQSEARRAGATLLDSVNELSQQGGSLLIEADPLLGNLPWPAVEANGAPLGLQFDLEELPSLLLPARTVSLPASTSGPLIVGASTSNSQDAPLPEVLDEAREVARFGRNTNLLLAGQATETQVISKLENTPALHFAGHAMQMDGATRLLLAPSIDGKSYLDGDLLRKHPPRRTQLAVFSACSTGKREEGWNHGMGDIVNTLAALGVPDVVATRWQIDSASAVPMMDAFYGGLAQGFTVPHALTAARQSLARDTRYRHPYYWAAYYASGSGNSNLSQLFHAPR